MSVNVLDAKTHIAVLILALGAGGLLTLVAQYRWPLAIVVPAATLAVAVITRVFLRFSLPQTALAVVLSAAAFGVFLSMV